MRTKQSFWVHRYHENGMDHTEWLIVTANKNPRTSWYDCLTITDSTVFDHFQHDGPLRDLTKLGYIRVKLEECPPYVPKWAKRELE